MSLRHKVQGYFFALDRPRAHGLVSTTSCPSPRLGPLSQFTKRDNSAFQRTQSPCLRTFGFTSPRSIVCDTVLRFLATLTPHFVRQSSFRYAHSSNGYAVPIWLPSALVERNDSLPASLQFLLIAKNSGTAFSQKNLCKTASFFLTESTKLALPPSGFIRVLARTATPSVRRAAHTSFSPNGSD